MTPVRFLNPLHFKLLSTDPPKVEDRNVLPSSMFVLLLGQLLFVYPPESARDVGPKSLNLGLGLRCIRVLGVWGFWYIWILP